MMKKNIFTRPRSRTYQGCRLVAFLVAFAFAGYAESRASFKDLNIVLMEGGWEKYDKEYLGKPMPPVDDKWKSPEARIVVLIAALREARLPETLLSMFDNAKYPERIYAGIVQQNADSDLDAVAAVCQNRGKPVLKDEDTGAFTNPNGCKEFSHIRMIRMDVSEAAGPVYARGRQPELVEDADDFCMQIDAHTIFKEGWDALMLEQWGACNNEYAVLSTYPTNYKDLYKNSNNHWEMPHLCKAFVGSNGLVRNAQASAVANLEQPILAPLWAAGLSFSRCHAERNVPNDVNLRHIFTGEEFARGARLWTHGYDFYTITRPIIGVYYGGEKGGKGGWRSDREQSHASAKRIATLLHAKGSDQSAEAHSSLGFFDVGTRRTLDQYYEFSGINVKTGETSPKCMPKFVPWNVPYEAPKTNLVLAKEKEYQYRAVNGANAALSENSVQQEQEVESLNHITSLYLISYMIMSIFLFFFVGGVFWRMLKFGRNMPAWEKYLHSKRLRRKNIV